MNNNFKIFLRGIADVSPLMIPVVPFGLIFGVIVIRNISQSRSKGKVQR